MIPFIEGVATEVTFLYAKMMVHASTCSPGAKPSLRNVQSVKQGDCLYDLAELKRVLLYSKQD